MKLNRAYFKKKHTGKEAKADMTECCNQSRDRNILNKNNSEDWELMEEYCEKSLIGCPGTEAIEIICCKKCGRLIKYLSTLKNNKRNWK